KSPLLRGVKGREPYDDGAMSVLGTPAPAGDAGAIRHDAFWRPLRRRIGVVFQAFHLYPHLSARDNVSLAPRTVLGLDPAAAATRADGLLESVGLSDKTDAFPRALSGGQRQR